jgi:DNA-binding SARP family transcriptional activator
MMSAKQISHDSYYKMEDYHQISIDLIEETEVLFNEEPYNESETRELIERLGAKNYDIGNVLEVFNPDFKMEISDLKDLSFHIDTKIVELKKQIKS